MSATRSSGEGRHEKHLIDLLRIRHNTWNKYKTCPGAHSQGIDIVPSIFIVSHYNLLHSQVSNYDCAHLAGHGTYADGHVQGSIYI